MGTVDKKIVQWAVSGWRVGKFHSHKVGLFLKRPTPPARKGYTPHGHLRILGTDTGSWG